MTARRPAEAGQRSASRCRRCGRTSEAPVPKPSRLPVFALALLAVVVFDAAVVVGLLHGPLYGAGLLPVWYALCLAAFGVYEKRSWGRS